MLNIIICDDELVARKNISMQLNKISNKHDLFINVSLSTDDPNDVLSFIKSNKPDLILLDIDLKRDDFDGISLSNAIRNIDSNILIVFLTARMDRVLNIFDCTPFDFIPKPSFFPKLEETILRAINGRQNIPHGNFIKIKNEVINSNEIIYIEKQLTKSLFFTTSRTIEISISFIDLLSCLPDNFIQIAKSYIVNKNFILTVNDSNKQVILNNSSILKFSNKYINNLGGNLLCMN